MYATQYASPMVLLADARFEVTHKTSNMWGLFVSFDGHAILSGLWEMGMLYLLQTPPENMFLRLTL